MPTDVFNLELVHANKWI